MNPSSHSRFQSAVVRARSLASLGLLNLGRKASYQAAIKLGVWRYRLPTGEPLPAPTLEVPQEPARFALQFNSEGDRQEAIELADRFLRGELPFFDGALRSIGSPPRFLAAPGSSFEPWPADRHWSEIDEFSHEEVDIKDIWEPSRFCWLLRACVAYRITDHADYLLHANEALGAWTRQNPLHAGPNWRCAQETAFRLIHFLLAHEVVGGQPTSEATWRFVSAHLNRIAATGLYARAQDNDHVATEGLGLFYGGLWAMRAAPGEALRQIALRRVAEGRSALERTTARLIGDDGSFANYSLAYHRIVLDCLAWSEWARRAFRAEPFSDTFYRRFQAARGWLSTLVDPVSGDAPNFGANDSGRIAPILASKHRNFCETLTRVDLARNPTHLAGVEAMLLPAPMQCPTRSSSPKLFDDGGIAKLCLAGDSTPWITLRFARFRFRPAHADIGHVDVWHQGQAIVRDTGSYRYQTTPQWLNYFGGTGSHNTVEFDNEDQMPRISRFLYGRWLRTDLIRLEEVSSQLCSVELKYRTAQGAEHHRLVELKPDQVRIVDRVSGFQDCARLHWHLAPADWRLTDQTAHSRLAEIEIEGPIHDARLDEGWESLRYGEKSRLVVFTATTHQNGAEIQTTIHLTPGAPSGRGEMNSRGT